MVNSILNNRLIGIWLLFVMVLNGAGCAADDKILSDTEKIETIIQIYQAYKKNFPEVEDISAKAALALSEKNPPVFVDIRRPEEQAVSQIAGALTEKMVLRDPRLIEGKTAIAYCTIGYRSGIFAEKMNILGYKVLNLEGGLLAWVHIGGKIYTGEEESKRLHIFAKKWDFAPQQYETTTFGFWKRFGKF